MLMEELAVVKNDDEDDDGGPSEACVDRPANGEHGAVPVSLRQPAVVCARDPAINFNSLSFCLLSSSSSSILFR